MIGIGLDTGLRSSERSLFSSAALDLDLTNPATAAQLTTTRASTAYSDNAAGVWSSFVNNIPRITDKGLLVEEARTNSIRNNSMQGAVAGTPGTPPTNWTLTSAGGLTLSVVGVGVEDGIDYIDLRWEGTANTTFFTISFETTTDVVAADAQVWTLSHFMRLVAGAYANNRNYNIQSLTAAGALVQSNNSSVTGGSVPATWTRTSATITLGGGGTVARCRPVFVGNLTNGAVYDFTLRIGWPQLELGAFVTSPIRTTTVAVTRAADVVRVTAPSALGSTGSLFFQGSMLSGITTNALPPRLISLSDGTNNNLMETIISTMTSQGLVIAATVTQAQINTLVLTAGVRFKPALAWATNDFAAVCNGGTVGTDIVGTVPGGLNTMHIGNRWDGLRPLSGYVERVAYWLTRLANVQLQALTT